MCGILGLLGPSTTPACAVLYDCLQTIQHRGQDAAGIATNDGRMYLFKGEGLVRDVFKQRHLELLKGHGGIAHVRYPTYGHGGADDAQPFMTQHPFGIALAHNGQVTNFTELSEDLRLNARRQVNSGCDGELLLHTFADELAKAVPAGVKLDPGQVAEAVRGVFRRVKGAYSAVALIAGQGMVAFRDPFGIRPLILGRRTDPHTREACYMVASESVACDMAEYRDQDDVAAGEMVYIDDERRLHRRQIGDRPHRPCVFESIYFARPDSFLDKVNVYKTRLRLGASLAEAWRKTGLSVDVIIPVPDSARPAATEMARLLGVRYREGLVKNRYVGRTFIMAGGRTEALRQKHNTIRLEFEGRDVLLVDDSIVRGNTVRQLVAKARCAGARKVYFASYSAPLRYPCVYGIDMATQADFIARDKTVEEVRENIGADFLLYQELEPMIAAAREGNPSIEQFCAACFTGNYPTEDITEETLAHFEAERCGGCR